MINALIYPSAPNAGIPHSFGFISVVQIILELIRSAITHSPITIFRTSLRSSLERSSATWRSRLISVCPFHTSPAGNLPCQRRNYRWHALKGPVQDFCHLCPESPASSFPSPKNCSFDPGCRNL